MQSIRTRGQRQSPHRAIAADRGAPKLKLKNLGEPPGLVNTPRGVA